MVSWSTIQSLLLFFGPWLLPKLYAYYKSIRSRPKSQLQPLPLRTTYALSLLFLSGLLAFLSTFPLFHPENIFRLTSSRLHTSTGVLYTRLASIRPLTLDDEILRGMFETGGVDARLLYLLHGPNLLLNTPFATPGTLTASRDYLLAAIPTLAIPHILHLFALGIATSRTLVGKQPANWRTLAILSALSLFAAETYYISTYTSTSNARSTRVTDIDFVHWKLLVYRGLSITIIDMLLALALWLQGTGRAFISAPPPGERIADHASSLEKLLGKVRGVGVVRNATARETETRRRIDDYWIKEGEVMKDVLEEPEVIEAQRSALKRMDTVRMARDAETFVETLLGPVQNLVSQNAASVVDANGNEPVVVKI